MGVLIRDLLAFAHATSVPEWVESRTDLNQIAREAIDALRSQIQELGAEIVVEQLPTLAVEATRFQQVFQNLISNALRYGQTSAGLCVRIFAEKRQQDWIISVSDNGVGIEPEYHAQIFEMFKRLHSTTQSGTGLGLSICQKIVERVGGRIWVESEPQNGATFRFSLPINLERT